MIAVNREKTAVVDALLESDQIDVNLPQRVITIVAWGHEAKGHY